MNDKFIRRVESQKKKHFPMELSNGVYCDHVSRDEIYSFIKKHYRKVFKWAKGAEKLEVRDLSEARIAKLMDIADDYFKSHSDNILFYNKNNEVIGWTTGESQDHVTYYMRNTGLISKYRGKGIYSSFLPKFMKYLEDVGYERTSSNHLGSNPQVMIPKLREGFIISGMEAREDFGLMVKMTKLLKKDRSKVFLRKFF